MYGVSVSCATLLANSTWAGWMIMQGIGRFDKESGSDLSSAALGQNPKVSE
jgi:hypothetical protein